MKHNLYMARRGSELSDHILYAAKNVFLEVGFERASMDMIALRAKTSKRTLYAHFESKEKLFFAIIELVRKAYLGKIKTPGEYAAEPVEALVGFLGRYLESLIFVWTVRMCRMIAGEAERFPEGSLRYFDVIFTTPHEVLSSYLKEAFALSDVAGDEAATNLIGRTIYPRFQRTLFGIEIPLEALNEAAISSKIDLAPIRAAVAEVVKSLRV